MSQTKDNRANSHSLGHGSIILNCMDLLIHCPKTRAQFCLSVVWFLVIYLIDVSTALADNNYFLLNEHICH